MARQQQLTQPRQPPLLLLLLMVAVGSGHATITDVFQLPSESFQLVAAQWLFAGHGFVNDSDAVYQTEVTATLCDCTTRCFVDIRCVSLSYDTANGDCRLNSARGHPSNTHHQAGILHRIRPRMAVLGDWCAADSDCTLLTSSQSRCVDSTCRCPPGEVPTSDTHCALESSTNASTTPVALTDQSTTATASASETSGTTSAPGQTPSTSPTIETITPSISPEPSTTTELTTTPNATPEATATPTATPEVTNTPEPTNIPSTTLEPTTTPATAPESSTTPTTITTTPEPTTIPSTSPEPTTTPITTPEPTTIPPSTTAATTTTEPTTTTAATTTTEPTTTTAATTTTEPTTTTAATTTTEPTTTTTATTTTEPTTTTAATTTAEPTTTTAATTTTEPTTTTLATTTRPPIRDPEVEAMGAIGDPVELPGSTGANLYTWVCGGHPDSGASALVGMMASGGQVNQFAEKQCADFSTLPGLTLAHSDAHHLILADGAGCPGNSVVVAIQDSKTNANSAIEALCVPVEGGYNVDCAQTQALSFSKNAPVSCDTYYAVTGLRRDTGNNDPWTGMTCCKIVPAM